MNNSEILMNAFSESFFFKELTFSELEFYVDKEHKVELADLLINLGDSVLAIQLKARDKDAQTNDISKEMKWVEKKCKAAKSQIGDTIAYIRNHNLKFKSNYGQEVIIDSKVEIVPLVVFMNDLNLEYDHILKKHDSDGLNCISFSDYCAMCKELISPGEIIAYLKWRKNFYLKNGNVNLLITDTKWGMTISKPQHRESLVTQYLIEMYGEDVVFEDRGYLLKFNEFLSVLSEHTVHTSEDCANVEIVKLLAKFYHTEITNFVTKVEKSLLIAKKKNENKVCGSLGNTERKSVIVFIASKEGEYFNPEYLYEIASEKCEIDTLLQVFVYWVNDMEFGIDFWLYKEVSNG